MILSRRVQFGGEQLDELDESIVIRRTDPGVPREDVQTQNRMGGWGSRMTGQHWSVLEASATFAINIPKRQMARRREVFDMVVAWANRKGWLQMNQMPDRRMYVEKTVIPGGGDMWEWLNEYTIIFRAYGVPFWENISATEVTKNLTKGSVSIEVGGTAPGVLDVSFQNISGMTIKDFMVNAGGNKLTLSGVNIASNETLTFTHPAGNGGLLRIYSGSRDVYALRTGADDLVVKPGTVNVSVEATRAGKLTVSNKARWL